MGGNRGTTDVSIRGMSVWLCVWRGSEGTYDGIVRGDGSGLMLKAPSEPAGVVSSSVENLTAGFTLLGDVSVVERSTILLLGVRLRRPDELVCTSLVVAVGIGRSFRSTDGSRKAG